MEAALNKFKGTACYTQLKGLEDQLTQVADDTKLVQMKDKVIKISSEGGTLTSRSST